MAHQLSGDTKAVLSTLGRARFAKLSGDASDEELERRFGSALAQRAMLTAMTRSFQPRMAFGFQGEIQFELMHAQIDEQTWASDWWRIQISTERAVARRRIAPDPAAALHLTIPDFVRVVSGVVNPVTVWFKNDVQIEGDVTLGARMVELFGGGPPFEVAGSD